MSAELSNGILLSTLNVFTILHQSAEYRDTNICLGGHSIANALALADLGAAGATRDEIRQHFGLPSSSSGDLKDDKFHDAWKKLNISILTNATEFTFLSANQMFLEATIQFLSTFTDRGLLYHGSAATHVSFSQNPAGATTAINEWVKANTNGLIPKLLGELSDRTRAVLINACYFKGKWQGQFNKESTSPMPFFTPKGAVQVPTMYRQGSYRYYFDMVRSCHVVILPYVGHAQMLLVIPYGHTMEDFRAMTAKVNPAVLAEWNAYLQCQTEIHLYVPKFKIESSFSLKDALIKCGVTTAFVMGIADFSHMCSDRLHISEVIHKACIEVSEEGTEAAAATAVIMVAPPCMSYQPPPVPIVKADRPFLYFISESVGNTVLFAGQITNPVV